MENEKILKDYSDIEKGAYLGAIASIATADRQASEEEVEHLMEIAEAAGLSENQKQAVTQAATELSGDELKKCLDILKNSDLRFSLITDMISFAESDKQYTTEEKDKIEQVASYLNITKQQFSLLDQFVQKTNETEFEPEEVQQPNFLSKLGLDQKFKQAGINGNGLLKGLLGVAGPMLLAGMLSGGMRRGTSRSGLGGLGGGLGGLVGGRGLGSVISMLNGGRGFGGNTGGLLGRLFR